MSIRFRLIDNETNQNLQSVSYKINNDDEQTLYAEEDEFRLDNRYPLDSITLLSYFHKSIRIQAKDLLNTKTIQFFKKQFYLSEVVLDNYITKGVDVRLSDHSLRINTASLSLLAGETDGDVFNVLHNIPGIHSPSGKSGNLNFRGNTYDQNLVQIDDIPIYHSGHYFGAISPYNTAIITNIEVQRNMLPAKYGGRVGGLINMTTSNLIPDSTQYDVAVNTLFAGATIKTKLVEDKLSFSAAFRTSYPGFSTPKLEAISTLIFQGSRLDGIADQVNNNPNFNMDFSDMNAKLNYKINDRHSLALSFINIQNNLAAEIKSNGNSNEADFRDLELDNWGITGKWKAQLSDKLTTELRFSKSNMNLISVSQVFVPNERSRLEKFDNTISDTRLIAEATYAFNPSLTYEAGYSLTNHQLISNEIEQENNIDSRRNQNGSLHATYLTLQKNWNDKLTVNVGIHNNYFAPIDNFYINPRISASLALNNRLYLKSSFGTSNQFIQKKFTNDFDDFNITNQLWFLPNKDIRPLKGTQAMLGGVYNKGKWLVDLELYSKNTTNITNKSDETLGTYTFFNTSKSLKTVIGLSILNLYNQDNTVNIFQNTTANTFRKASEFAPNLQINLFF